MKEYNEQVVETLDDAGCIIANKNIIIDNLQARIAELEEENARLKVESRDASLGLNDYYGSKLAAAQAECEFQRNAHKQAEELMLEQSKQLAAAQKEIEQLKATPPDKREDLRCVISDLCRQVQERDAKLASSEQLAAEQLNNKLLREALKMVTNKVCWSVFTDSEETQIEEALSPLTDAATPQ